MRYIIHRRAAALLMLMVYVTGCATWRTETQPVPELLAKAHPAEIRVMRRDSTRIVLYQPTLSGDTLTGSPTRPTMSGPAPYGMAQPTDAASVLADTLRSTVPLTEILRVDTRRTDAGRTALLFLAIGGAFGLAALITVASMGPILSGTGG